MFILRKTGWNAGESESRGETEALRKMQTRVFVIHTSQMLIKEKHGREDSVSTAAFCTVGCWCLLNESPSFPMCLSSSPVLCGIKLVKLFFLIPKSI